MVVDPREVLHDGDCFHGCWRTGAESEVLLDGKMGEVADRDRPLEGPDENGRVPAGGREWWNRERPLSEQQTIQA